MGSCDMALKLLLTCLVLSALLVLAGSQGTPASEASIEEDNGTRDATNIKDASEERRVRLRNFFARRREQRVKPGKDKMEKESKRGNTISNSKVQPRLILKKTLTPEATENSGGEKVRTSVSVSSSVSSTQRVEKRPRFKLSEELKPTEKAPAEQKSKTQRKRFRLIKNSKVKQDELLEKLLANIDLKNEVRVDQKENQRPFRFRPSLRRDQLRKKAKVAIKPKTRNRINPRKQQTTTTETITTTTEMLAMEPVETTEALVIESIEVNEERQEEESSSQPTSEKTEVTPKPTEQTIKVVTEATTEAQTSTQSTSRTPNFNEKTDRTNFFRRNNPRKFSFGRRPLLKGRKSLQPEFISEAPKSLPKITLHDKLKPLAVAVEDISSRNNLPEKDDLKFSSFPVLKNQKKILQKDEVTKPLQPNPVRIEIAQPIKLPQPFVNEIEPAFIKVQSVQVKSPRNRNPQIQINTIRRPNSIVQAEFSKPTQFRQPSSVNVPETVRSVSQPFSQLKPNTVDGVNVAPQPKETIHTKTVSVVREPLFPKFTLPDFFNIPFAAFNTGNTDTESSSSVFNGVGQPAGSVQGHPRAANLNIKTGTYSIRW